jgi:polysaccharide biosynthesis protein PslH
MKILLLTQVLPYPPDSGPKVKTWNVIKYLAANHEVTLASFVRGDQSEEVKSLRKVCKAVHTVPIERRPWEDIFYMGLSFMTGKPFLMVRDDRREMRNLIDDLVKKNRFDVVHADQLNMAQYALRVPAPCRALDAHNALWLLYRRLWETMSPGPKKWLLGRDWRLLKHYEGEMLRRFDTVLAVSEEDRAALQEAAGEPIKINIIPITVDTDEFVPVVRDPSAGRLLHIGTMYWPPNVDGVIWFIKEVLPLIHAKRPEVEFDVVGARPPQELLDQAAKSREVNVTGYVEDPTPYLRKAGAMVVPLRAGGGMRVKILNALAQGLPVVTTSIGCEGIDVEHGHQVMIADEPEDFAQAALRLLDDRVYANGLGKNGRNFIKTKHDYRVVCRKIDEAYKLASHSMEPLKETCF